MSIKLLRPLKNIKIFRSNKLYWLKKTFRFSHCRFIISRHCGSISFCHCESLSSRHCEERSDEAISYSSPSLRTEGNGKCVGVKQSPRCTFPLVSSDMRRLLRSLRSLAMTRKKCSLAMTKGGCLLPMA